ncbi:hypothetical protein, variant [Loa loa]|uniref:Uncharacterized protein n=1 Tax=Loa loa TaxID=7209 RepID=A0A1S0UEV7_LOALO|nr:hypothetical protein, variant [Loa loa]EJD74202.1 hypothetical protein, variant [Loa loa]
MKASDSSNYMRSLSTILEKISRWKNKKPLNNNGTSTTVIQKQTQKAFIPTEVSKQTKDLKFSESKAYFGIDKRKPLHETIVAASQSYLEACDSATHRRKVTVSFLSSFAAICFYFWYSRLVIFRPKMFLSMVIIGF